MGRSEDNCGEKVHTVAGSKVSKKRSPTSPPIPLAEREIGALGCSRSGGCFLPYGPPLSKVEWL